MHISGRASRLKVGIFRWTVLTIGSGLFDGRFRAKLIMSLIVSGLMTIGAHRLLLHYATDLRPGERA